VAILILIPIGVIFLTMWASGSALTAHSQSQAQSNWWGNLLKYTVLFPFTLAKWTIEGSKWIAAEMFPALKYGEQLMT